MSKQASGTRTHGRLIRGVIVGASLLAIVLLAVWYLRSEQFKNTVRNRVIAYLENATNGRVELGSLHWSLSNLEIDGRDLTIHGIEGANELPFAHADRFYARLQILSFIGAQVNLRELLIERPVVHVIVYPDGSTNAPELKTRVQKGKTPVQQLFDLAVGHADVHNGVFVLNERKLPLDFSANDVQAGLVYDLRARRYDGILRIGKMDAQFRDWRDFAAQAALDFSLWENTAEVKSFKLTSQKSSLEAAGKLTNFTNPRIDFSYNSNFDLGQLGAIARQYNLRAGSMTVDGSGRYFDREYSCAGKLAARGIDYIVDGLDVRGASLSSNYILDRNRVQLTRLAGRVFAGEVTGDAEVKNYTSSSSTPVENAKVERASSKGKKAAGVATKPGAASAGHQISGPGPQQGIAHLRVSRMSASELARTFSSRAMPLAKLKPVGSVDGTINLAWMGTISRANAELALDVAPPAQAASDELPVTATGRAHYNGAQGVTEFSTLNLATRHSQLNATGTLGARSAEMKVALNTTNLVEFQPALAALGDPPLPIELSGQASFNGTFSGKLQQPQIAGHVQATNFNYLYTPPPPQVPTTPTQVIAHPKNAFLHRASAPPHTTAPTSPVAPRRIHLDLFSGDVQYSAAGFSLHHGVMQQGSMRVNVDGVTALQNGSFTETTPFQIEAVVRDADVDSLQQALGTQYPVNGVLNLNLEASGTEQNPQGHGEFSLKSGQAYGRPVKSLTSKLVFANHEAQLNDIRMQAQNGVVTGSAAYNLASKTGHFDLVGDSVDLAEIPELQAARFTTAGTINFTAKGSGSLENPVITAHLQASNLVLNGELAGGLVADAVTHGSKLQLTARSQFPLATLSLDGTVDLKGDLPSDLTLQFDHLDIDPFLRTEMRGRITGHSVMAGQAHLAGPLRAPDKLNGILRVDAFKVEVEKIPLASEGPIELSMSNQVITVQHLVLTSEDSRFTASGTADLKGDRPMNLQAKGHINLKLAQTIDPDLTTYGTTEVDLKIDGTMAQPVMTGHMEIAHGGASMIDLPAGLGDVNGSFTFSQNRVEVERLSGRAGGGLVNFTGYITFGRTIGFDLNAKGNEIRFRYAGVSVTSDQELRLLGTLESATLNGDITVTRFAQIPSADLTQALAQVGGPAQSTNQRSPLNNLHLDVRILSAPELTVQTSLAKLSGDVDLRLRGTPIRPVLLGRINIAEGDIKLNGAKYHLERGDITFADPVRIDPILDVEATTSVRDYDITVGLHGTFEKLNTTYRSDPPLSSDDIIALLAFGRTEQEASTTGGGIPQVGFAESASNAVLGQAINAAAGNRVSKLFGVSSIKINPSVGGPDNNPNARLTVEQQVSNNITITYITNLAQSAQQVIQFEYNINRQYTILGTRDENGVLSMDLLIRQRRK